MKLDVRATKIDENSEFAKYFAREAGEAFNYVFSGTKKHGFKEDVCNRGFKSMRRWIDNAMISYLVKNDGVIDG